MSKRSRSLLFVPGDNEHRLAKACTIETDAIIIDLEDAVVPARKAAARAMLRPAAAALRRAGVSVFVRINAGAVDLAADLDAAVTSDVQAIMAPKIEGPQSLLALSERLAGLEIERGLEADSIKIVALIESPAALPHLHDIAAVERVSAMALGSEDFSLAMGVAPTPIVLDLPCRQVALAAATRGLMALTVPLSIAAFRDAEALRSAATLARAFGATGMLCVHPDQARIANEIFSPSPEEFEEAKALLSAWESQGGAESGVIQLNGRMVDKPVVDRARRTLERV